MGGYMSVINNIWINGFKIVSSKKDGKKRNWKLSNGMEISTRELIGKEIEIECNECNGTFLIKFYMGKNGLVNKKYICQSCSKIGNKNPFFGKKHDKNFTERLSNERKGIWGVGNKNGMFGKSGWEYHDFDTRKKRIDDLKEKNNGMGNPFFGRSHSEETKKILSDKASNYLKEHPDHMRKMGIVSLEKQRKGFKSSIEKTVEEYLISNSIKYKYNKILHRKYQFDFIIEENILLEVMGDYWHANPLYYGNDKKPLNERQIYKVNRDKEKSGYAKEYGYKIFYIWETEIRKKDFSIIDAIIKEIKNEKI
jgi:G:T-mismatch repair DNA endonuclease (very short patch repair protein)/DNA-directed RNA polymerase subunit RPC12/RpoP